MIKVIEEENNIATVEIGTPWGTILTIGEYILKGPVLEIHGFHMQGLWPGALEYSGVMFLICIALLELKNVDTIKIFGARRTTGRRAGAIPRPKEFARAGCDYLGMA